VKRTVAIILSLVFAWLQAVASVQTAPTGAAPKRGCCSCGKSCCVTSSAPESRPPPVAPLGSRGNQDLTALTAPVVAWIIPTTSSYPGSGRTDAPRLQPAVSLFTQHCALLI
jgi:hypothetical protein